MRWRSASGVMCDKRISLKLKGKFYRVAIRPTMLYGSECWPMTKAQASQVEVAEMRMLRWSCGKTLSDRIPTGVFRAELEVGTIINKLREGRLRWFGHVRRRDRTAPLRRAESIHVEGIRRRGRPKMRWEDRLAKDLIELGRFGIYAETLLNLSTLYMVVIICVLMSAFSYTFRAFDATFLLCSRVFSVDGV
uniref:uncharacterized protein LOC122591692 n=1 Tax=Erigeron canadensis TaxID=72917 RepID=UPI001CB8925D|nr:uncharacterized protein LOC122591692 [Erigeron canadensis]